MQVYTDDSYEKEKKLYNRYRCSSRTQMKKRKMEHELYPSVLANLE